MKYRNLGKSGLKVPLLSLGTGTFGGTNEFFQRWGQTDVKEASRLIDICIERGVNFFDTANVYSQGASEEILGKAIKGKREKTIISTKGSFEMGKGINNKGSSRSHIIQACEDSLKRLNTDYIDLYFIHGFDGNTPIEETLRTLNTLVLSGKVRYIGCSNFASWQLMKSLSVSEQHNLEKYIIYQGYYSLIGRDYEQELMPLLKDQEMGLMVWSPLGWGRLTGKIKRNQPISEGRIKSGGDIGSPPVENEFLYNVIDVLDSISNETGKSIPQIAINWLTQNRTVSNIVIGARNEIQLLDNLNAIEWTLTTKQMNDLNEVSKQALIYPHWVGER
ncbi:aryl-alcohol dehydrogenase-like predicted oxidoreductase [Tenacibaculum adriaticum]|uniref:Aryl-alcohol dehydrogenase-like predicted oxidoreductase n=1 Tax=Tenacibaculum adriaticum TaxID=413713 RepID=A0A5S5DWG4_9FLAO|nr:aldo/keto reductase [Tenacibaculum adriaticum]TYQ00288.1 aryl-alcohol dehydrogenase-like predicted oxidoreductase [Tenacibaculum adriaticum]